MHLYTDEGDIDTTSNHPFYVIGKGWVAAGDLAVGDEVYNLDGTTSTILGSKVEVLGEPLLVYNLEVEDLHSYFVGCVPVLVHNYGVGSKNPNTKLAAATGRQMHKTYDYGGPFVREVPLGKAGRADAVDFLNHIVYELKPNSKNAIRKGIKQLNRYVDALEKTYGGNWIKILVTY